MKNGRRSRWVLITRRCGRVIEKSKVCLSEGTVREKKKHISSKVKQAENEKGCERQLARTLNCNFRPGDYHLTLTYDAQSWNGLIFKSDHAGFAEEISAEDRIILAAERDLKNWILRVKRNIKKAGGTAFLSYIAVVSDIDGDTGESRRVHIHCILPAWAGEIGAACWKNGLVDLRRLKEQDDYTPLAQYLLRQVRRRKGARKYMAAQNMEKPQVTVEPVAESVVLKPRKGEVLQHASEFEPGANQYIRVVNTNRKRPAVKLRGRLPQFERGKEPIELQSKKRD